MSTSTRQRRLAPARARSSRFFALYRLLLRTQITVPRLLGIGALGALSVVIGVFARLDDNPAQAAADAVSGYGLGILVPLATLWLGTSAIGDLVEDQLLVYLSLKPVPRWQLPAAAVLATVSVVVPLTALPLDRLRARRRSRRRRLGGAARRVARRARVRRAVRRGGALVSARDLVGARLRPDLGERRRLHGGGRGALHGARLGVLRSRPGARRSTSSSRPAPLPPRSSCFPRSRSRAGWPRPGAIAAPISTRAGERAADDDLGRHGRVAQPLVDLAHAGVRLVVRRKICSMPASARARSICASLSAVAMPRLRHWRGPP